MSDESFPEPDESVGGSPLLGSALARLQQRFPLDMPVRYSGRADFTDGGAEDGIVTGWSASGSGVYVDFSDGSGTSKYVDPALLAPRKAEIPTREDDPATAPRARFGGDEHPFIPGMPPAEVYLGPDSHLTTPIDSIRAHQIADQADRDPNAAIMLIPTLGVLDDTSDGGLGALAAMRALSTSVHKALHTGFASDLDALASAHHDAEHGQDGEGPTMYGSHLGEIARVAENAIAHAYGERPDLIARLYVQRQVDVLLEEMDAASLEALADQEGLVETDREPAAPVQEYEAAVLSRPANEAETIDAVNVIENVLWDLSIDTMADGSIGYAMSDEADLRMQSYLRALALDAADAAAPDGEAADIRQGGLARLRVIRGILTMALAHVGEAIQVLDPRADQRASSTSASGIQHDIRLGAAAEVTPAGHHPGYHEGSVATAVGRDVSAAIASLETGATVVADVDFSVVTGVHPALGEIVTLTLPVRLEVTGVVR